MDKQQERAMAAAMKEAREKARGYADFFGWAPDRDLEEWGVVARLSESFEQSGETGFADIRSRGRGNDPPDCEAMLAGERIAIEVTELVCAEAVRAFKAGCVYEWAAWSKERFCSAVSELITRKNARFSALKGGPYPAGYALVIFTDEPLLDKNTVSDYLQDYEPPHSDGLSSIYFLISFDPEMECCPFFKIK